MLNWIKRLYYNRRLTGVSVQLAAARQSADYLESVYWECIRDREEPPRPLRRERRETKERIELLRAEHDFISTKLAALDKTFWDDGTDH